MEYDNAGKRRSLADHSDLIKEFESQSERISQGAKRDFIDAAGQQKRMHKSVVLTPYFDYPVFKNLLIDLCHVVWDLGDLKKKSKGVTPGDTERDKMYTVFIGAIDKAISEIQKNPLVAKSTPVLPPLASRLSHRIPSPEFSGGAKTLIFSIDSGKEPSTIKKSSISKKPPTRKKLSASKNSSPRDSKPRRRSLRGRRQTDSTDPPVMGVDNTMDAREDVPTGSKRQAAVQVIFSASKRRKLDINKPRLGSPIGDL